MSTLPRPSSAYKPWDTIEVIANHASDFACKRCGEVFALMALVAYPGSGELKKAYPYWCHRCDGPPRGQR